MSMGLHAAERLSAFHAEIFLNRRKQVGGFPSKMFGCTIDVTRTDEAYRRNVAAACDYIVIPFSWRLLEPKEQQNNFKLFDDWMDWASKKRIPVRGSSLVSFTHANVPDWVYIWEHDFETIRDLVCEHVRRVIGRYSRHVQAWEVISGIHADSCFSFNFEQLIELTRVSTAIGKQMAPRSQIIVDLVMPWGEYYAANQRTIPPMLYAEMIVQGGINFDAFGVQFYSGVGVEGMYVRDIFQVSSMLDKFAVYGKPLHITGVSTPSSTSNDPKDAWKGQHSPTTGGAWHKDWSEELQRAWMRRVYHIALSKPFIDGITWRDLGDDSAHYVPHGGLLRADGTPKPAFEELLALRREICSPEKGPAPSAR
jgi:GH35 family endo-1,4-beta-xylanase